MMYEEDIIRLLWKDPTKTYTENDIQVELIGTNFELWDQPGPPIVDKKRRSLSESLAKLVQSGKVYKKIDGSEITYGIKMSLIEKIKFRIHKSDTLNKTQHSGVSLDRRVKRIHQNWLTMTAIFIAIITPILIALLL